MSWDALLTGNASDRYVGMLEDLRERAGPSARSERALAGCDEAIAAVAVLRGAAAARPFAEAAGPLIERTSRKLAVSLASIDPLSMLMLLSFTAIGETTGASPPKTPLQLDSLIDPLLAAKTLSKPDRVALALLTLARGRAGDVRRLVDAYRGAKDAGAADPIALVKTLAAERPSRSGPGSLDTAWDAFVAAFPVAWESKQAEWRHLVLAARIVLPKLGRAKTGDVAESLHRLVNELAKLP